MITCRATPTFTHQIRTFSREDAGKAICGGGWHNVGGVISIGDPGSTKCAGYGRLTCPHLRLEFDDIVAKYPPERTDVQLVHEDDVKKALNVGNRAYLGLKVDQYVVVHCAAGISRSTGIAYALRCQATKPGQEDDALMATFDENSWANPNSRVVWLADKLLGRGGAMINALHARVGVPDIFRT